jgi:hypothetical protein
MKEVVMLKTLRVAVCILVAVLVAAPLFAATVKTYQVTGPVLEVTSDMIAVQKGQDRWEIARDANTKVTGDLKVGAKVTIEYRMSATAVEVKPAAAAKSTTTPKKK